MRNSFQKRLTRTGWAEHYKGSSDRCKKAHRYQKNGVKRKLDKLFEKDYSDEIFQGSIIPRALNC